jgi:hypothetical protein
VGHPSLGLPPRDLRAGFPDAAQRLRRDWYAVGVRALEIALDRDPSIRERHAEVGLRRLLRDTEAMVDRLAIALAGNDPMALAAFADWIVVPYRRRGVPMDDLVHVSEGLRGATPAVLGPDEQAVVDVAVENAIRVYRWHRRLAGDARKRNRLLSFLYKGA